jgi:hypothetical protein
MHLWILNGSLRVVGQVALAPHQKRSGGVGDGGGLESRTNVFH